MASSLVVKMKKEIVDELVKLFLSPAVSDNKSDLMELANQLEQAHWHYLDLLRPEDASLPACSFKEFVSTMLHYCPTLTSVDPVSLADQWKSYKHKRPVRGAILLNNNMNKCVLVQGYPASTSWSFPKGKKESNEGDVEAAIREVYEEVGLDIKELIKLDQFLEVKHKDIDSRMYIITDIPEDTNFEPKARKEIRKIQWFHLKELPSHKNDDTSKNHLKLSANKFYVVLPYVGPLRQWIHKYKRNNHLTASPSPFKHTPSRQVSSPLLYSSPVYDSQISSNTTPNTSRQQSSIIHSNTRYSRNPSPLRNSTPLRIPFHTSSPLRTPLSTGSLRVSSSRAAGHSFHTPSIRTSLFGHPSFYNPAPSSLPPSRPLQPFFGTEREESPEAPPTVVKTLFNTTSLRPSFTWTHFRFETEAILKAFHGN